MEEVQSEHQSTSRKKNFICYVILAVATTAIFIHYCYFRDVEIHPLSQNDGERLLNADEVGPNLVLNITNEIINGDDVYLYEYPWFVQLEDPSGRCSASLIAPEVSLGMFTKF